MFVCQKNYMFYICLCCNCATKPNWNIGWFYVTISKVKVKLLVQMIYHKHLICYLQYNQFLKNLIINCIPVQQKIAATFISTEKHEIQ